MGRKQGGDGEYSPQPSLLKVPSPSCCHRYTGAGVKLGSECLGRLGVQGACALSSLKEAQGRMLAEAGGGGDGRGLFSYLGGSSNSLGL